MPKLPEWCPVAATLEVIGGKWTPLILFHLKDQPRRFNELRRLMPTITQRMLTLQLRELEEAGIVQRTVYAEVPPRVEYQLTPQGRSFLKPMKALVAWADTNHVQIVEARGRFNARAAG